MSSFLRQVIPLLHRAQAMSGVHHCQSVYRSTSSLWLQQRPWQQMPWQSRSYAQTHHQETTTEHDKLKQHCKTIFDSAVKSVSPKQMIQNSLSVHGDTLSVVGREYRVNRNVYIAAFGKAVIGMVRAAEDILGDHLVKGLANVPFGIREDFLKASKSDYLPLPTSRISITEGALHNMPDEAAHNGAMKIYELAQSLGSDDLLIVLISGGGSALLPAPIPPVTLADIATVTSLMSKGGATIMELNAIRKNLELLKGGGLVEAASPAQVVSLILSDVIGDPLDFIASGPTVQSHGTARQCLDLMDSFQILPRVPESVVQLLQEQNATQLQQDDSLQQLKTAVDFSTVQNEIVGSNKIAVAAAQHESELLGYLPYVLSTTLDGDAEVTGQMLARLAVFVYESMGQKSVKRFRKNGSGSTSELQMISSGVHKEDINRLRNLAVEARNSCKPICIISAGETTVHVQGTGRGGRNQQLILSAGMELDRIVTQEGLSADDCVFQMLSAGTDGQDGPTPVAGALADPLLCTRASQQNLSPEVYLEDNDTFTFYTKLDDGENLVNTGLTGTNVMDVQIMLIQPKYHTPHANL